MFKEKEYYVPIELTVLNTLIVKATSQSEAILKVNEIVRKNENAKLIYDRFKILGSDIICKQDDEMFDELAKDFKLEVKEEEHPVVADIDEETENKTYETISSTVCEYNKAISASNILDEEEEGFLNRTLSAFGGSDVVFIIDGKVFGEIQELKYNSIKKEIEITMDLFSTLDKVDQSMTMLNDIEIVEYLFNEAGDKIMKTYQTVSYIGQKSSHKIDDQVLSNSYLFSCQYCTNYTIPTQTCSSLIDRYNKENA